ncbi:hypothetical protein JOE38_002348 [Clavibacter michiganensis]|nr:hypothetical protein [Clavibacter michiganensis]
MGASRVTPPDSTLTDVASITATQPPSELMMSLPRTRRDDADAAAAAARLPLWVISAAAMCAAPRARYPEIAALAISIAPGRLNPLP